MRMGWSIGVLLLMGMMVQSCGLFLASSLESPKNLSATTDLEDRIELEWSEVRGATAYNVYRSADPSPPLWTEGEYGPVPHAVTTATAYVDPTNAASTYYYQVTAVQQFTGTESDPTAVVEGASTTGPAAWQPPALVSLNAVSTLRLATDKTTGAGYVLSVPIGSTAAVTVNRVAPDGSLTQLGSEFGSVDGDVERTADIIAFGGQIRVVLARPGTGSLEVYSYVAIADTFLLQGTLGTARPDAPLVTTTTRGSDDHWLAYQTADTIETVRFSDSGTVTASEQLAAGLTDPAIATGMEADAGGGVLAIVYETEDGLGATTGASLHTREDVAFTGAVDVSAGSGSVSALAVAVDPGDGSAVTIVADDTDLYLNDESGSIDRSIAAALGGSPLASPDALSIAARSGSVLLLYTDTSDNARVQESDDLGINWAAVGPDGLSFATEIAPAAINAAEDTILVALTNGGFGVVRTYQ